jgi:hypothetical protein
MKKRSIRKQRGGNPTEGQTEADGIDSMIKEEEERQQAAKKLSELGELGTATEDEKAEKQTIEDKKEIAKQSARDTVSMLKIPLTIEETKLLRRLVFFNIYTQHNTQRKQKYKVLQKIYKDISGINYVNVEKIEFVITELLKTNIFSGAMIEDSPDNKIKKMYVDVSNQLIDINKVLLGKTQQRFPKMSPNNKKAYDLIKQKVKIINSLINKRNEINIKEKKQPKQIKEELSEVESKEIVKRELAKRKAAEQAAEQAAKIAESRQAAAEEEEAKIEGAVAEEEAKRKAVEAAEEAAEGLRRLKVVQATREANEANLLNDETTYLLTSIKGKLEEINNDYTKDENYIQKYIEGKDGILNTLRKNYGTINGLHKSINERNTSILEINKNAPEDIKGTLVTATKTLATATKTLKEATTEANKLKEIIQVLQIINNNFDIINGNTPGTKKEDKLSKIAEQKYIVIPDPSNNINKDYFCEGGIPAEAKKFKYYIIFLDGYVEGTKVKYNNIPIKLTEEKHNIENCLSKI